MIPAAIPDWQRDDNPCLNRWNIWTPEDVGPGDGRGIPLNNRTDITELHAYAAAHCRASCVNIMLCRKWAFKTESQGLRVGVLGGLTPMERDNVESNRRRRARTAARTTRAA